MYTYQLVHLGRIQHNVTEDFYMHECGVVYVRIYFTDMPPPSRRSRVERFGGSWPNCFMHFQKVQLKIFYLIIIICILDSELLNSLSRTRTATV